MDQSALNYVSVNEILHDVTKLVADPRMDFYSKGGYTSLVQQALEGLSFDTFFDIRRESFDFPVDSLSLDMPLGAFNIKEIYLYHGTECDITRSQKVWHKRNYYTKGAGYFANNKGNNVNDPFYDSNSIKFSNTLDGSVNRGYYRRDVGSANDHYFYNVQNGVIMFSSPCRAFEKVHVVFNGTGCDIGDEPIIPLFLREAVKDFVCEEVLRAKMAIDPKMATLWSIYEKRLNRDQKYGFNGSWPRAEYRVKTMSSAERSDLFEYLGRPSWGSGK
jgi:hypothetical protein